MVYVQRDGSGKVCGCFRQPQEGYASEELPDDHPDVVAYLRGTVSGNAKLDAQIRQLEAEQLLPRVTREVHLGVVVKDYMRDRGVDAATAIAQLTDPAHAGYNLGFSKLKAFDDQIKALRAQRV